MKPNEVSKLVLECAYKMHTVLGPGLLESAYEACLKHELITKGLKIQSQLELPLNYCGTKIDVGYRLDLLVEDMLIIELKAVDKLMPVHQAQLLSYLKLSGYKLGLLINFNVPRLKQGIKRLVNNL